MDLCKFEASQRYKIERPGLKTKTKKETRITEIINLGVLPQGQHTKPVVPSRRRLYFILAAKLSNVNIFPYIYLQSGSHHVTGWPGC